ncbi:MAG: acetyl-CoA carboxylase biotin carboxyl carrier protein [Myxococcales bacterium]|nr:acetyl-CoA carboxylase biotin carboxyl carrier protein [Myxococcales bacterium]MDH3484434.1 acetyl-CoA carboxylase biotin carboxyl carrier protein [Myxococcales bacterium]
MKLNLDQLRELIQLLDEANLTEIEVKQNDDRIRLRRDPAPAQAPSAVAADPAQPAAASAEQAGGIFVTSPFVGTFYRASSPDDDSFVEVGDRIAPGQVLCIVEAMKLMNEIEAEIEGEIAEILVENGKPVEYGDRLFRIEIA